MEGCGQRNAWSDDHGACNDESLKLKIIKVG
jgi:hypothetical protein